jgi:hypothetical protein
MMRKISALVVIFILGGLLIAYRDRQLSMALTGSQGTALFGNGLADPPNWKVEPVDPAIPGRTRTRPAATNGAPVASVARYGTVDLSPPPLWGRRNVKPSATAATNIPRNTWVEPRPTVFPNRDQRPATKTAGQSIVAVPNRNGAAPVVVADAEHRDLLRHAQFLIKAGLAPVAKEPLQQIIREVPGTPIAREARLTLDTIRN